MLQIGTDTIDFDAILREEYGYGAVVTEHPVERGVNLADHLRPNVVTIAIDAVISNTPTKEPVFGSGGAFAEPSSVLQFSAEFDRLGAITERLRSAQVDAEFCVWTGQKGRIENLVVSDFRAPYTVQSGFVMPLTLTQVRTVELRTVEIPQALFDRAKKKRKKGKVPPKSPANAASTLSNTLDYGTSVL